MKSRMVPQLRMFLHMAGLTLLWCVAVGAANHAAAGDWLTFEHTVANLLDCAKVGALLGVIAVAVALLFGGLHNPGRFKLVMALGHLRVAGVYDNLRPLFNIDLFRRMELHQRFSVIDSAVQSSIRLLVQPDRGAEVSARDFTEEAEGEISVRWPQSRCGSISRWRMSPSLAMPCI